MFIISRALPLSTGKASSHFRCFSPPRLWVAVWFLEYHKLNKTLLEKTFNTQMRTAGKTMLFDGDCQAFRV